MADKRIPTPDELRQLLRYDPDTGRLFWNERPVSMFREDPRNTADMRQRQWNTRYSGTEAGTPDKHGYLSVSVFKRPLKAHRVIWAILHSEWPNGEIDHVDGNPRNNRLGNLRLANRATNTINTRSHSDAASKYKGVSWHAQSRKWRAQISIGGNYQSLGLHQTEEEAARAYNAAVLKHNPKFARLNAVEG